VVESAVQEEVLTGEAVESAVQEAAPTGEVVESAAAENLGPVSELNLIFVQHALCAWDSWWCTLKKAVEDAERHLGVNVTVLGPDEFDLEKTAALIDQAVAAQPDGIA
jgi:ABC-type sugar transport system substrate-binding protein